MKQWLLWVGLAALLLVGGALAPLGLALSYQVRGGATLEQVSQEFMEGDAGEMCVPASQFTAEARQQVVRAMGYLRSAQRYAPTMAQSHLLLGRAYCMLGDYQNAIQSFLAYIALRPQNPLGHLNLAFAYAATASRPEESPYSLLEQAPVDLSGWRLSSQEMSLAVMEWQAAGTTAADFHYLGDRAFSTERYDPALSWYEIALWLQIEDAATWLAVGEAQLAKGSVEQALQAYRMAWICDAALVTEEYAALLEKQGSLPEAEEVLRQALETLPDALDRGLWWSQLGQLLTRQQRWLEAQDVYSSAIAEYPSQSDLHIGLGWAGYNSGVSAQAALDELAQAIVLDPDSADGYYYAALLLTREQNYVEADSYYAQAIERQPEERWYRLLRANTARSAGNLSQAIELYQDLIARFPVYAIAYYELAWAYKLDGSIVQAQEAIQKALDLMKAPDAWYYVRAGIIFEAAGDLEEAIEYYRHALVVDSSNSAAVQALARLSQP